MKACPKREMTLHWKLSQLLWEHHILTLKHGGQTSVTPHSKFCTRYMLSVILVESQEVQESIFANLFARSHFFSFLFSDECLTKIQSNFRIVSKSQWNYKVLCYFKIGNMCREHLRSVKQNLIKIKQNSSWRICWLHTSEMALLG